MTTDNKTPTTLVSVITRLIQLAHCGHHTCEDCYYSCPAADNYCGDERACQCTCGADEHNAEVDALARWIGDHVLFIGLDRIALSARYVTSKLSLEFLRQPRLREWEEFVTGNLIHQLDGYVWGKRQTVERVTYPRDWWQAARARWCPQWWLVRYPVVMTTVVVGVEALWPTLKIEVPDHQPRLKLVVKEE